MNINEFILERKEEWDQLEAISAKFRPGFAVGLSREDLWKLGRLYTGAVADLAVLRSSKLAGDQDDQVVAYLNALVIRVHGMIYRKAPFRWSSIWRFLSTGFPVTFRRTAVYTALSTGVFLFFGVVGFVLGLGEPGFIELLVPQRIISQVEQGQVWFKGLYTVAPQASTLIMTNNISVTFLTFAAGITFGLGTLYLLALNGLLLGTVAVLCFKYGLSEEFWSFVLPHGSLELTAIFIAGGAGLILGNALVDPGPYRRSEKLSVASKRAVKLALGCVPVLLLAGLIEAFFSPSPLPSWLKFLFAAVSFTSLMVYFVVSGRGLPGETDDYGYQEILVIRCRPPQKHCCELLAEVLDRARVLVKLESLSMEGIVDIAAERILRPGE